MWMMGLSPSSTPAAVVSHSFAVVGESVIGQFKSLCHCSVHQTPAGVVLPRVKLYPNVLSHVQLRRWSDWMSAVVNESVSPLLPLSPQNGKVVRLSTGVKCSSVPVGRRYGFVVWSLAGPGSYQLLQSLFTDDTAVWIRRAVCSEGIRL